RSESRLFRRAFRTPISRIRLTGKILVDLLVTWWCHRLDRREKDKAPNRRFASDLQQRPGSFEVDCDMPDFELATAVFLRVCKAGTVHHRVDVVAEPFERRGIGDIARSCVGPAGGHAPRQG